MNNIERVKHLTVGQVRKIPGIMKKLDCDFETAVSFIEALGDCK